MKNKSIILTAMLTVLPSAMMAQENIQKAFDALLAENIVEITTNHSLEREPETGRKTLQADIYDFMVTDPSVLCHIKDIQAAFEKDKDAAYLIRSGDHAGDNYATLAVGDGRSQSVAIGKMKGSRYIYACFLDKDDPEKKYRYAYAMEWVDDKDDKTRVRLAVTYATTQKYREGNKGYRKIIVNGQDIDIPGSFDMALNDNGSEAWLTKFNTLRSLFMKKSVGAAANSWATQIYKLCKNAQSLEDYEKEMVITEIKKLKDKTTDEFIQQLFDMSIERLKK